MYQPFLDAIRAMEAEARPTLYLVPVFYSKLSNYLKEAKESPDTTKAGLAESIFEVLEYKKNIFLTQEHYMALMLNPKHNGLIEKLLTSDDVDAIFAKICEEGGNMVLAGEAPETPSVDSKFGARKRQRQDKSIDDELDDYITVSIPAEQEDFCLLSWWKENSLRFPKLSKLARKYHSIPATSASVERLFSILNMLTLDERLSLTPEALGNMIKLRTIFRLFP